MVCIESAADVAFVASHETCEAVSEIISAPLIPPGMLRDRFVAELVNSIITNGNVRLSVGGNKRQASTQKMYSGGIPIMWNLCLRSKSCTSISMEAALTQMSCQQWCHGCGQLFPESPCVVRQHPRRWVTFSESCCKILTPSSEYVRKQLSVKVLSEQVTQLF